MRFPVRFSRRLVMHFRTDPPPEQVSPLDGRHFGVYVAQPVRFTEAARAGRGG